ncbi:immunity protein 58 [Comamonas piscis]|uniref:Immunity protein 58 n=1 Tax=Comamonas piscis TaxID=1562974 RepID=A0A7G5EL66_9BURK|nr:Imm58 family immunity protein [Comamonas piscis]QMV74741.1 immunity protein 58 [Comamonas piscis]WSO33207.1 Imm58 family immunity protein [Comamonas piscis]
MSKFNRWKISSIVLGACCFSMIYKGFDDGITLTYMKASMESTTMHAELIRDLIEHEWMGLSKEEVISRLNAYAESRPSEIVVIKKNLKKMQFIMTLINFASLMGN